MKQILKIGINNYRNMKNIKSEINKISDENKIEMEGKNYAVRDENGFAIVRKTAKKLDDRNLELSNEIARNRLPSPKRST